MKQVPKTVRELLEISPAAQLLLDGTALAAASPSAMRLFPEAKPGEDASALLGDFQEDLTGWSDSCLMTLEREDRTWDIALAPWEGFTLCTLSSGEADRSSAAFSALSDTLRRPLSSMVALTPELLPLLEEQGDERELARAAELNQSLYRLLRLADNLQLQGAETGLQLRLVQTDLDAWLSELAGELEPLCQAAGLQFRYTAPKDPCRCPADRGMLERALLNVVSNAMKFSDPGGAIDLSLRRRGKDLWITVRDQGCGIPPDQMGALYARSVNRGPVPDPRWGAGLGLPAARQIILAHGGRILIESRPGEGTRVHLALPRRSGTGQILREPVLVPERDAGLSQMLLSLADVLPPRLFDLRGTE